MTIDERLEKLTERHEALAQSVEMIAIEGRAQATADHYRRLATHADAKTL